MRAAYDEPLLAYAVFVSPGHYVAYNNEPKQVLPKVIWEERVVLAQLRNTPDSSVLQYFAVK